MMILRLALCSILFLIGSEIRAGEAKTGGVLLLIADDLGRDIGCYGNSKMPTRNLDRLAAQGVRFDNAFTTVASCSPSRSVMFTGQYNHTNGMYGLAHAEHHFHVKNNIQSLPAILKKEGIRSGIIAKEHVTPRAVFPWTEIITDRVGGGRDVVAVAERAKEFIAASKDQPFLLVVGYTDPHRAARGFANESNYAGIKPTVFDPANVFLPYFLPDKPAVRADVADYCQSISRLDQGVGRMLDVLKETGRDADTLVIFLSDNGMPFPGAKTTVYDPGVHLPLLISSPRQKTRGVVNQAMVSWIDLTPTILDSLGAPPPSGLPGRSLLPILEEPNPAGWDKVYLSHTFHEVTMYYPMRAVRTREYKYIWNIAHELPFPFASDLYNSPTWQSILKDGDKNLGERTVQQYLHRPKEELYDLRTDPKELKNVAGDPQHAEILKQLREDIRSFQERTKDPWLVRQRY
jgi:N-sulfoglucosamine sulfohydrolase